jgi:hypothetical protein
LKYWCSSLRLDTPYVLHVPKREGVFFALGNISRINSAYWKLAAWSFEQE